MEEQEFNIDRIIETLLVKDKAKTDLYLTENEIKSLCERVKQVFLQEPCLLENLKAPITICGNLYGCHSELLDLFEIGGYPPQTQYLFLGNYIDIGKSSINTICLLFAYKIKYPDSVYLLRGNHECSSVNRIYGFYDECKRMLDVKMWKLFNQCFNCLPFAAIVNGKIFCVHAGISPVLQSLDQIRSIIRPVDIPDEGLLCDLVWAEPVKEVESSRLSYASTYEANHVKSFVAKHEFQMICRSHQYVANGYEYFAGTKLVTIYSSAFRAKYLDGLASIMIVDESLNHSFKTLGSTSEDK